MKSFIRYILVVLVIVCSVLVTVSAENLSTSTNLSDYATNFYNEVKSSSEWQSSDNHAVRVEMLQLPETIIAQMDTATLVDAVLAYPFYNDIYAFNSIDIGMSILFSNFNGIRALATRPDAAAVLLEKYKNMPVSKAASFSSSNLLTEGTQIYKLSNLEALITQDFVINALSSKQLNELNDVVSQKHAEKQASDLQ
ncbi:MAG: hypothetical protein LBM16_04245 [Clostridiales bacterium]|jgi:hypothetical protein|nr:hypothetical protein [Clostridiales bacterium]